MNVHLILHGVADGNVFLKLIGNRLISIQSLQFIYSQLDLLAPYVLDDDDDEFLWRCKRVRYKNSSVVKLATTGRSWVTMVNTVSVIESNYETKLYLQILKTNELKSWLKPICAIRSDYLTVGCARQLVFIIERIITLFSGYLHCCHLANLTVCLVHPTLPSVSVQASASLPGQRTSTTQSTLMTKQN